MYKKIKKDTKNMMVAGIGLGVASELAPSSGIGKVSGAMPKIGTLVAGSWVLNAVNELNKSTKKIMKKK